jgi:predicted ATPase
VVSLYLGRPTAARAHLEQALALDGGRHSLRFTYLYDPRVVCLSFLSATLFTLGYPDQALSRTQQALAEAHDRAHPESLAFAMNEAAGLYLDLRNTNAVQEQSEKLIAFATEQGFPHFVTEGKLLQAWMLAQQGAINQAIGQTCQCLTATQAEGKGIGMPYRLFTLAELYTRGWCREGGGNSAARLREHSGGDQAARSRSVGERSRVCQPSTRRIVI